MADIKIKDLKDGMTLEYDPIGKLFVIRQDNTYLFQAETQDKLEAKLDRYIKSMVNSRCPVKVITSNGMDEVTITSFNTESEKVWMTRKDGRGQYPLTSYSNKPQFFENTEKNKALVAKYQDIQYQIAKLNAEARGLETSLECPITPEWFKQKFE